MSALSGVAVVPSDSTNLTKTARALFIGTGGNLSVILADDSTAVLLKNIPNGTLLPIAAKRVKSTSTTAADIVALY